MRMPSFPSRLLQAGVAPVAAVMVIAVAAPGTTLLATPATQPAARPPVLTATPVVDEVVAAPVLSSVADLEVEAIALADEFGAVPVDVSGRLCPVGDLAVRWTEPEGFTHGAFIAPLGPPPADGVDAVNGVVVCGTSTWAYMGFEADHDGTAWQVTAVPYVNEGEARPEELNLDAEVDPHDHADEPSTAPAPTAPAPTPSPKPTVETSAWLAGLGPIEPYAAYEPQSACSPTAKPGTVTKKDALLSSYPVTRNLGIARACHLGGRSEHKEGRAFDWGAYVSRAGERASVEQFLTQLLATDADGNRHALARRMGVMYVIWNGQIWSAYRPGDGWRRYGGPNPHTDHVHVSLSRAGGAGKTSFFAQGLAAKGVLREVPPGASAINTAAVVAAPTGAARVTTVAARPTETRQRDAQTSTSERTRQTPRDREFTPEQRAAWEARRQAADAEREARREQRRVAEDTRRAEGRQRRAEAEAQQQAERQARREAEAAKRAEWQQRRAEAEAQQRAERQARREAAEAERQAQRQRRQEAEAAKRAEWQRRKEAAEAAWRDRRQRRQPAPSPSPTVSPAPSPSPTPEPTVSSPEPVVAEPAPTEGG